MDTTEWLAAAQVGLGPGDLGQRQIAAFLVEVSKAVETVAAVAHHPAGLGHAAQLLGQFQQPDLGLDHLALGCRHDGLSSETGRDAALRPWLRAPAAQPTDASRPSDHVKTSTAKSMRQACAAEIAVGYRHQALDSVQ